MPRREVISEKNNVILWPDEDENIIYVRGWSFLRPDTWSEGFLRGVKNFRENLRGMKFSEKFWRGLKFSQGSPSPRTFKNKGYEIFPEILLKYGKVYEFWGFLCLKKS